MAVTPPERRIWWNEPIERVELVWIVIAFLWGLFMFVFMIAWHFIGQQNLSKEAYRIQPSAYEAKVDEFAKKNQVREEAGRATASICPRSTGSMASRCSRPTSTSRFIPGSST
jgi:cytochrome c oxidase subunit II